MRCATAVAEHDLLANARSQAEPCTNKKGIDTYANAKSAKPTMPQLLIALGTGRRPEERDLTCLSPEEDRMEIIGGIARLLEESSLTVEEKKEHKRMLYCVPVMFIICDNDDQRFFHAIRERRAVSLRHDLVRRSGAQVIDESMTFGSERNKSKGSCLLKRCLSIPKTTVVTVMQISQTQMQLPIQH